MDDEPILKHCEADEQAGVHPYLAPLCLSHVFTTNVSQVRKPSHVAGYMTKSGYITKQTNTLEATGFQRRGAASARQSSV